MSKKIVIIENDSSFSHRLKAEFEQKGLTVAETSDGKGAPDFCRKERPDLVVLAVELAAGQSGYLVCGKLKKDDELKKIPVIIVGKDADGFESHRKLKTHAEEYLKKPCDPSAVLDKMRALIDLPEPTDEALVEDESLGLGSLGDDEPLMETKIDLKPAGGETRGGDPELDLLDDAFETLSENKGGEEPVQAPEEVLEDALQPDDSGLDALSENVSAETELALDALEPIDEPSPSAAKPPPFKSAAAPSRPPPAPAPRASAGGADPAEVQELRQKREELEARVRELEDELASKGAELDSLKGSGGGRDKEFFALKDQNTKKDKEILRLKQELNDKEKEVVELQEKENSLEQRVSELGTELAKKDAQVKTFNQRTEAWSSEKKKLEAATSQAREEARTAASELEELRNQVVELGNQLADAKANAEKVAELQDAATELRARIIELEQTSAKNEDRAVKAYQKIKNDEKLREKTRKAIQVALQMLEEGESSLDDGSNGEQAATG